MAVIVAATPDVTSVGAEDIPARSGSLLSTGDLGEEDDAGGEILAMT